MPHSTKRFCKLAQGSLACLAIAPVCMATTLHVDAHLTTGANNGLSWNDAFRGSQGLQSALAAASAGDEVWVADGRYFPGPAGSPRTVSFAISEGVKVYGGFAGGEMSRESRNPANNVATLDGDLAQNGNNFDADNSLHVVRLDNRSSETVIDGFTILNGIAVFGIDPTSAQGGGILVVGGAPVVRACVVDECESDNYGGGIAILGSSALIEGCTFRENRAQGGNGLFHGDNSTGVVRGCRFEGQPETTGSSVGVGILSARLISSTDNSRITVEDCTFAMTPSSIGAFGTGVGIYLWRGEADIRRCDFVNLRTDHGGAGVSGEGTARIDRCRFIGCEGRFDGGAAIHNFDAQYTITNCLFAGNDKLGFSTLQSGGVTEVVNCTFYANGASNAFHSLVLAQGPDVVLKNCVMWGNLSSTGTAQAVANPSHPFRPTFLDCLVQGWNGMLPGSRCFNQNPEFVSALGADGIAGTIDDDLRWASNSPAIDRGNNNWVSVVNTTELAGAIRRMDVIGVADLGIGVSPVVDLGAFERAGIYCDSIDFNNDTSIFDPVDIEAMLSVYSEGPCIPVTATCNDIDFNNDDSVFDPRDIDAYLSVYSEGPCL